MKQPHIKVEEVRRYCIISGNPDRVPKIARYLEDSVKIAEHRGLVAYEGVTPKTKTPVTVLTTGMGGPTTAIVLEEAYRAGGRIFIRVGSCGSLVAGDDHCIGTIYIPQGAIRAEGVSDQLVPIQVPALASRLLQSTLVAVAEEEEQSFKEGLVVSSDIYYTPDGSKHHQWAKYGGYCVEMESAVLFSYCRLKEDMSAATIITSDGNLQEENDIYDSSHPTNKEKFDGSVDQSIKITLNAIDRLEGM